MHACIPVLTRLSSNNKNNNESVPSFFLWIVMTPLSLTIPPAGSAVYEEYTMDLISFFSPARRSI